MSRRCHCRTLFADRRLALLPLAAQGLLFRLVDILAGWTEPGGLRIAGRPLSNREIALLVCAEETEVSNHLETLVKTGFVNRSETDGAVSMPLSAVGERLGAARGGRPKRGETAAQAALRRGQGNLVLPIQGGRAETDAKPVSEPSCARTTTAASSSQEVSQQQVQQLGDELTETTGLDPARQMFDYRPIAGWLAAGIPAHVIRDAVGAVAARPSYQARQVRGFGYFDAAVREAAAMPRPAPMPTEDPARAAACRAYTAAFRRWREAGMLGAPPRQEDFAGEARHAA